MQGKAKPHPVHKLVKGSLVAARSKIWRQLLELSLSLLSPSLAFLLNQPANDH